MSAMLQSDMPRPPAQAGPPTKAKIIIDLLGAKVVAKLCGWKRVQTWRYMTGRLPHIPAKHHSALRRYAESKGIELPAELFVHD